MVPVRWAPDRPEPTRHKRAGLISRRTAPHPDRARRPDAGTDRVAARYCAVSLMYFLTFFATSGLDRLAAAIWLYSSTEMPEVSLTALAMR